MQHGPVTEAVSNALPVPLGPDLVDVGGDGRLKVQIEIG